MTERAGDMGRCSCGAKIEWRRDWRDRLIKLDVRADPLRRPTFLEVEMGEFVEVHRHECEPPPKPQPYDGRDVRPKVKVREPAAPAAEPQFELFR